MEIIVLVFRNARERASVQLFKAGKRKRRDPKPSANIIQFEKAGLKLDIVMSLFVCGCRLLSTAKVLFRSMRSFTC